MDIEAGKTLTNEEVIRELLELLKKNAMKEQANKPYRQECPFVLYEKYSRRDVSLTYGCR